MYEHPHVADTVPDVPKQLTRDDRRRIPLTVYIGGVKRLVGVAVMEGDEVEAYIDPKADIVEALVDLVSSGVLQTVSIAFNAPPATPVINNEGQINWHKNY